MTGKDIFKIWAPVGAKWVDWVRPVPFIGIKEKTKLYTVTDFIISDIKYINKLDENTAIIVDLPSSDGIKEGLGLAKLGFRPIPLYNGTNGEQGAISILNNQEIETDLIYGALELKKIHIRDDAPPAFLLDSNRTHRFKMNVSVFDNSWDIYSQDMPSVEFFKQNNINKIIVRGEKIQRDLKRILYKFQKENIQILLTNGYEEPKKVTIKKVKEI